MGKSARKTKRNANTNVEQLHYEVLVKTAQSKADPLIDIPSFKSFKRGGIEANIIYKPISEIDSSELSWILCLEERNMEKIYSTCSWGWNLKKKKKEMTETEARYLIALVDNRPVAFVHFRFDMDNGDPVLYCYELQLEPDVRRKGLGKFLMQTLELLAFKNNMMKVILTVLKHNRVAIDFFHGMHYLLDETSPVENILEDIPYQILSKMNKKFVGDSKAWSTP